ncbi:exo-alpha-sialidase [Streptomyces roseolilacinus]|uniref:exo-alpha-sialidase n=1 Tax=Streptomyces roseolilacinus TaxID=66904 RepID=UPI00380B34D1
MTRRNATGGPADDGRPLLTLRVSRDGGRTWGERTTVHSRERLTPLHSSVRPPCACPRCASGRSGRDGAGQGP